MANGKTNKGDNAASKSTLARTIRKASGAARPHVPHQAPDTSKGSQAKNLPSSGAGRRRDAAGEF
jgi:hypothetical protein